jgi:hypothetical protein
LFFAVSILTSSTFIDAPETCAVIETSFDAQAMIETVEALDMTIRGFS